MRIAVSERRNPAEPAPPRRFATPSVVTVLALFVFCATAFCAVVGYGLIWQADERQALERRTALMGAIEDARNAGAELSALDPMRVRAIERTAGLKELRFETEPDPSVAEREVQSVLDRQGRIIGWFSWLPDRSMGNVLRQMRPLLALTGLFLIGFAGMALWQVHRALRDLTASEQVAWRLAHEDLLTGLPNYRKIIERIDQALALRAHGEVATLALIDLDSLDDVNDALGHAMGDALLAALGARLKDLLPVGAVCGRFDGDQFAAVAISADLETADTMFEALAGALARPFWINDQVVQVGVTIGLAHAPSDAQGRDELMRRADLALRTAKRSRRGNALRFERAMDVEFDERRFLERELKRALEAQTLQVHYQPIVSADGARIVGAEALLRWNHPARGNIPPDRFVPVAEASGLMKPLGEWVLRRALADARRWPGLFVSVNLSPVQVRDPDLVEFIAELLADNGLLPQHLLLEVTEGVLIDKPDDAKARLDALHALGVRLALDDFGTGYSSLSYLQRFRFDKLKIDRSFVAPLGRRANSQSMLQAIVALGRALDLGLLAEGVETEEQRVLLRLAGCEEMQGFLFARPAPAEALDALLKEAEIAERPMPRVA